MKNIIKSEADKREYKFITLENQLDVLLISDKGNPFHFTPFFLYQFFPSFKDTDKSAASMDVRGNSGKIKKDLILQE